MNEDKEWWKTFAVVCAVAFFIVLCCGLGSVGTGLSYIERAIKVSKP